MHSQWQSCACDCARVLVHVFALCALLQHVRLLWEALLRAGRDGLLDAFGRRVDPVPAEGQGDPCGQCAQELLAWTRRPLCAAHDLHAVGGLLLLRAGLCVCACVRACVNVRLRACLCVCAFLCVRACAARSACSGHADPSDCVCSYVQWCFENFVQARSMKRARDIRDQAKPQDEARLRPGCAAGSRVAAAGRRMLHGSRHRLHCCCVLHGVHRSWGYSSALRSS